MGYCSCSVRGSVAKGRLIAAYFDTFYFAGWTHKKCANNIFLSGRTNPVRLVRPDRKISKINFTISVREDHLDLNPDEHQKPQAAQSSPSLPPDYFCLFANGEKNLNRLGPIQIESVAVTAPVGSKIFAGLFV